MGGWLKLALCVGALVLLSGLGRAAAPGILETDPTGVDAPAVPPATEASTPESPPGVETEPGAGSASGWGSGIYVHVGGGTGGAIMSSDEITDLFGDGFGIGLGFHFSYSVATGFRNAAQFEVRRGDSAHTLRRNGLAGQQSIEIPMDYDFTEYVGKLNLLLLSKGNWRRGETALFLLAGTSEIRYLDEEKDGFRGNARVLGFEFATFARSGAAGVTLGLRRYDIEFDRITLFGQTVPFHVDASNWVLHTAITFGLAL